MALKSFLKLACELMDTEDRKDFLLGRFALENDLRSKLVKLDVELYKKSSMFRAEIQEAIYEETEKWKAACLEEEKIKVEIQVARQFDVER